MVLHIAISGYMQNGNLTDHKPNPNPNPLVIRRTVRRIILDFAIRRTTHVASGVTVGCSRRRPQFAADNMSTMSTKPNPNPSLTLYAIVDVQPTPSELACTFSVHAPAKDL